MSRRLDDLHPDLKPKAIELIARCVEAGIPIMIVDTLRTPEEHAANLAAGTSWTKRSKHLDGRAIDVAPWLEWRLYGPDKLQWDASDPVWLRIGKIGEALGLVWGGRWGHAPGSTAEPDPGHFELP